MTKKSIKSPFVASWLTPIYDLYCLIRFGHKHYKEIILMSDVKNKESLLDVGCATGTLLIEAKKIFPDAKIIGIDPDVNSLLIAKNKINEKNLKVNLNKGIAEKLPFKDNAFDAVVSTSTFHHITGKKHKLLAAKEIYRVLKPKGKFVLFDFGPIKNIFINRLFHIIYFLENIGENIDGEIDGILEDAGFVDIKIVKRGRTMRACWEMFKP